MWGGRVECCVTERKRTCARQRACGTLEMQSDVADHGFVADDALAISFCLRSSGDEYCGDGRCSTASVLEPLQRRRVTRGETTGIVWNFGPR